MKQIRQIKLLAFAVVLLFCVSGCAGASEKSPDSIAEENPVAKKPDAAKMKADMQALETAWATADNSRDVNAVAAFYAEDAVSLPTNKPMLSGKTAIRKELEETIAKRPAGSTISYEVIDAFGTNEFVTEVGIITNKDSTGKVVYTGKYMAVWELRDGKYTCIRYIYNDDVKSK